jgi:hypothetical protein
MTCRANHSSLVSFAGVSMRYSIGPPSLPVTSARIKSGTKIMRRLTFVDYGVHEDNNKPLNLRVYINSD